MCESLWYKIAIVYRRLAFVLKGCSQALLPPV